METQTATSNFTARIFELLDRVEYRRVQSTEDMEAVGRVRARAYKDANIMPVDGDVIIEDLDFDPQAYVFGVFHEERLISTIRIHHVTPDHRVSSSSELFSSAIDQFLDAGMSLVDPARLAADSDAFRTLPGMHLLTMRLAVVASEFFDADRCLSMVVPQHAAFYRRMIESRTVVQPTAETGYYHVSATLMASDFKDARERIYRRFPFFRAQSSEMRMLFGDISDARSAPLTILPTARYASQYERLAGGPPHEVAQQPEMPLQ